MSLRRSADNLAVLLARPDTDHVVPVLDGARAAGRAGDREAGQLRSPRPTSGSCRTWPTAPGSCCAACSAVSSCTSACARPTSWPAQLRESRRRLTRAREVERRRLVGELSHATTERLGALHGGSRRRRGRPERNAARSRSRRWSALGRARVALDELLDRFRVIARGVYPAVLRDQGPVAALDEVIADLPRGVRLTGELPQRLAWEVESGIYYLAAAAVTHLGDDPPAPSCTCTSSTATVGWRPASTTRSSARARRPRLRAELAGDIERLAALGGDVEVAEYAAGVTVVAWLPDRLEPLVGSGTRTVTGAVSSTARALPGTRGGAGGALAARPRSASCSCSARMVSMGWLAARRRRRGRAVLAGGGAIRRRGRGRGSSWARAVAAAAPASEPLSQAVLDFGFSTLNLVLAVVLLVAGCGRPACARGRSGCWPSPSSGRPGRSTCRPTPPPAPSRQRPGWP